MNWQVRLIYLLVLPDLHTFFAFRSRSTAQRTVPTRYVTGICVNKDILYPVHRVATLPPKQVDRAKGLWYVLCKGCESRKKVGSTSCVCRMHASGNNTYFVRTVYCFIADTKELLRPSY